MPKAPETGIHNIIKETTVPD